MADNQDKIGQVSSVIKEIPFGSLIGGPLSACINAQAEAAQVALDYVREASMKKESSLGKDKLEPETISFTFVVGGEKRMMVVPLLTILPVPFIRIEYVDLSFTADITACTAVKEQTQTKIGAKTETGTGTEAGTGTETTTTTPEPQTQLLARYTAPSRETEGEAVSEIQAENLIAVDIHAVMSEMPSGMAKLLEVFNTQLIQVDQLSEKTVERLKKKNAGYVPVQPVDPKKPKRPRKQATVEQKKLLRDAYLAAIEAGDEKMARKIRDEIILTHRAYDAKTFLRASAKQYEKTPYFIRVSGELIDNPDCEYIPELSIEDNIGEQVRRQRKERKKLRSDLIFAMMTAKKMFPNKSTTKKGREIFLGAWNARTHQNQGWYTYGGAKASKACAAYINSIIETEKARQEGGVKGGSTAPKVQDPEKVQALYDILESLGAQMLSVLGILIEGAEPEKPKNPKKAARAASKAVRQAKEAEDMAAKIAAEQKDKERKEAKAKDKAKDHAKVAATKAKKDAKAAEKKASAAKKKASSSKKTK